MNTEMSSLRVRLSSRNEFLAPAISVAPAWVTQRWTAKRAGALLLWWAVAGVALPVFYVVAGMVVGILEGIGHGFVRGAAEAYTDARKYWRMFEECE